MKKRSSKDLVLAQRANIREAEGKQTALKSLGTLQRKKLCQLEEEMSEVRKELRTMNRHRPQYFYSSRPSSARISPR